VRKKATLGEGIFGDGKGQLVYEIRAKVYKRDWWTACGGVQKKTVKPRERVVTRPLGGIS